MTTEQQFNCIFCKETFSNKEELQIHFRKHGDPSFKNRTPNDSPNGSEKLTDENEMVGCDVCEEVFPTISKAITHKHKVHPDHDAKYFCPFCGKLFTMKHLYNKHIQTNHDSQLSVEKSDFHCDCCEVMFYIPSAMLYHNKFFHRQDSELPANGGSKKVKIYSKETIQLFYCAFCGEEYNNKVNLHKHISDDHSDENQSPDEVLKCPLCEAIFHHLDAYELHLMFHSNEDEYSERCEMVDEVTEYSLETVPPIMEKVENESSQDNTADEALDMDNFLQLLIKESEDGDGGEKKKSKKHKKHKKSKKAAISLDEFLNMNKDVFGDGLDVQGIEEVPSQVMLKKMQVKKCPPSKGRTLNADINKLQKIGITVKTKSGSNLKPIINRCAVNQPTPKIVDKSKVNDPKELISKLMRQGNSQIKIVKKSATQNILEDESEKHDVAETITEQTDEDNSISNSNKYNEKISHDGISTQNGENNEEDDNVENTCKTPDNVCDQKDETEPVIENREINEIDAVKQDNIADEDQLVLSSNTDEKFSKDVTPPSNSPERHELSEVHEDIKNDNVSDEECSNSNDNLESNASNKAIGALKHLSHLVIKPVKSIKTLQDVKNGDKIVNSGKGTNNICSNASKTSEVSSNKIFKQQNTNVSNKTTEVLKGLNKNMIIKPVSNDDQTEDDDEHEKNNSTNKMLSNQLSSETQRVVQDNRVKKAPIKPISVSNIDKEKNLLSNTSNNKPEVKIEKPVQNKVIDDEIEIFNIDDSDSDDASKEPEPKDNIGAHKIEPEVTNKKEPQLANAILHNLGSNITIKSTTQKTNEVKRSLDINTNINQSKKVNKPTPEIQKSINLQNTLKSLGSHITIKSNNTSTSYSQEEHNSYDDEDEEHSDHFDSDSETEVGKVKITEVTEETSDVDEAANGDCNAGAIVQSPDALDNDSDNLSNEEDSDFDSKIKTNVLTRSEQQTSQNKFPDNIKCLNKDLVIKPVGQKNNSDNMALTPYENKSNTSFQKAAQASGSSSQVNTVNRNVNTSDDVNTVKTVKKFQTETVIEEITTVTRTIRTINESSNEMVQTNNQSSVAPNKLIRNQPNKSLQQMKVMRHAAPMGAKVRTAGNIIRSTNASNIRIPNQLVPIRNTSSHIRQMSPIQRQPITPGMQIIRKVGPAMNSPQKTANQLKMSPNVVKQLTAKRPAEVHSHTASNIKKYKESTISMATQKNNIPMEQYTASSSRSEFSTVTKTVQGGKSMMSATQTRSEVNTKQQLSRLSNMSGLKIMKTSTKQATQVEEKSEISASKRNTLEGIEKLQKLGLLVKKPRIEVDESNEQDYFSESEEDNNCEQ